MPTGSICGSPARARPRWRVRHDGGDVTRRHIEQIWKRRASFSASYLVTDRTPRPELSSRLDRSRAGSRAGEPRASLHLEASQGVSCRAAACRHQLSACELAGEGFRRCQPDLRSAAATQPCDSNLGTRCRRRQRPRGVRHAQDPLTGRRQLRRRSCLAGAPPMASHCRRLLTNWLRHPLPHPPRPQRAAWPSRAAAAAARQPATARRRAAAARRRCRQAPPRTCSSCMRSRR